MPRISARGTAIIAVTAARNSVLASRGLIRSETGRRLPPRLPAPASEYPKSPRTTPLIQSKYRTASGRSRPMSLRSAATVSGVAAWPSIDLAKSPGSISMASEMMIETTNSVTTPNPRRFNTVATIAFKASSPVAKPHTHRGRVSACSLERIARLGEPPAFGDFQAISWIVRRDVPVGQLLRRRLHVVIEHEDNDAAVVMDQLLDFGIHAHPLLVVGFTTCRHEQLIEARVVPMRLVPGRPLGIDRGHHPVDGRTAVPVASAPGFL